MTTGTKTKYPYTAIHHINDLWVPCTVAMTPIGPRGGMLPMVHYWAGYETREEALRCIEIVEAGGINPPGIVVNDQGERRA